MTDGSIPALSVSDDSGGDTLIPGAAGGSASDCPVNVNPAAFSDTSSGANTGNSLRSSTFAIRSASISGRISYSIWLALVASPLVFSYSNCRCLFTTQRCRAKSLTEPPLTACG